MTNRNDLDLRLAAQAQKLDDTLADASFGGRSVISDVMSVVVPMMVEQLGIIRDVLEYSSTRGDGGVAS